MSIKSTVHNNMIKNLVARRVTDSDGHILDVRTVVVIDDADGDPVAVFSPDEWRRISAAAARMKTSPLAGANSVGKAYGQR